MNLLMKTAVATVLVGASVSAFATPVVPPLSGPTPVPGLTNGGLLVSVFDTVTGVSLVEWLGPDSGSFSLANQTPAAGEVLDFGIVSGNTAFNSLFSAAEVTAGNVQFVVGAANQVTSGAFNVITTLSKVPAGNITNSAVANAATSINSAVNTMNAVGGCNNVNPCIAPNTSSQNYVANLLNGRYNNGLPSTAGAAGLAGGAAVNFYSLTQTGTVPTNAATKTLYANATGDGAFTLSATGDLVYSIPGGVQAVPLPAAVWLLGSGLLGLAGVGRRKRAA